MESAYEWIPVMGLAMLGRRHENGVTEILEQRAVPVPSHRRCVFYEYAIPQPRTLCACGIVVCVN
jgi:hypothetical protein